MPSARTPPAILHRDDPQLAPTANLDVARRFLRAYRAPNSVLGGVRQQIVKWIDRHPHDAHQRSCWTGHLTASALVFDPEKKRVLLTHHRKLDKWLQLGGHCDGDANLAGVALREAEEESGISGLGVLTQPIDVDIHVIPPSDVPEHLHLDTRFLVLAPPGAKPVPAERESKAVRWMSLKQALEVAGDASVARLVEIARTYAATTPPSKT